MNRRAFLALLGSGVIGAGLDVDRLLWVPGAKTIFLPPAPKLYTTEWMMKEALAILRDNLTLVRRFDLAYGFGLMPHELEGRPLAPKTVNSLTFPSIS